MSDLRDDLRYAIALGHVGGQKLGEVLRRRRERNREEAGGVSRVPNAFRRDGEGGSSQATIGTREECDPSDEFHREVIHSRTSDCRRWYVGER